MAKAKKQPKKSGTPASDGRFKPGNPGGPGGARPGAGRKPQVAKEIETAQLVTPLPDDAQLTTITKVRKAGVVTAKAASHPHPFAGKSLLEAAWATCWELLLTGPPDVRAKVALAIQDRAHGRPTQALELSGEIPAKWYGSPGILDRV